MQLTVDVRLLAFAAISALAAMTGSAFAQPSSTYVYRIPIPGLTASNPPVDNRPEADLQALAIADFGSSFTHLLMGVGVDREFVFTNLGGAAAQITDVQVSGNGFAIKGGSCGVGVTVEAGQSCTALVNFESRESATPSNGELRLLGDIKDGNVALSLSGTAITAFRDSILGTPASVSADRLTATWNTSDGAGTMRVGVGQLTGRRYIELIPGNTNLAVGIQGGPGLTTINLANQTTSTTMTSPAPYLAAGEVPRISANDRIGLAMDFFSGDLILYVNCSRKMRITNIPTSAPLAMIVRKPNIGAQAVELNAGSAPFGCAVPEGYKAGW